MTSALLPALIGAAIGLALGMLGGGVSILTVPALVYLLGQDAHAAVGTSLVIVGANALLGATLHRRQGHVRVRAALLFGAYGLGAAFVGARLSRLVPSAVLLVLFALLLLLIALIMLRGGARAAAATGLPQSWQRVLLGGVGVGFLTGFLGVGGGFLLVPALVLLLGLPMREAVGTSLVVIAINSAAGLLGHLGDGALNWGLIGLLVGGGTLGILAGTALARRLSAGRLRSDFAAFVVVLALGLLTINLPHIV
jgi:uncharacterized membrane protein YfcA